VEAKKKITFKRDQVGEFYQVVRERVDRYFSENNISKNADWRMVLKTTFIISSLIVTYSLLLSNKFGIVAMLFMALYLGFCVALIGLNVGHDAIHGAYSANRKVNRWLGTCFNIVGANDHVWKITHNIIHHSFTNIPGADDDIDQSALIRLDPTKKVMWHHQFQHIYVFFLYPLTTLTWFFYKDYVNFFKKRIGWYENNDRPTREFVRLFGFKLQRTLTSLFHGQCVSLLFSIL